VSISLNTLAMTQQKARPLHWWSERQLALLVERLKHARGKWLAAWVDDYRTPTFNIPSIVCRVAHEHGAPVADSTQWHALYPSLEVDGENQVWVSSYRTNEWVAQLLLKPSIAASRKNSIFAAELSEEALADCISEIKNALSIQSEVDSVFDRISMETGEIPVQQYYPWSGAVNVLFPLNDEFSLTLHIGPGRATALLSSTSGAVSVQPAAPLAALKDALSDKTTHLRVELLPVDISVGNLQSLTIGDVLVVPHLLTQQVHVKTAQGEPLCGAYLGQAQGQKAIELTKLARASQGPNE